MLTLEEVKFTVLTIMILLHIFMWSINKIGWPVKTKVCKSASFGFQRAKNKKINKSCWVLCNVCLKPDISW